MWEHFHHQADIGVRGIGETVEEAFEEAASALTAVVCNPQKLQAEEEISIVCEADDVELLLVDWLNALIYEMSAGQMLFNQFEVHIEDGKLSAKVRGEKADPQRHETAVEVKGATYHKLSVQCDANGKWVAQCVVDV